MHKPAVRLLILILAVSAATPVLALAPERQASRFDRLVILDPSSELGTTAESPDGLAGAGVALDAWKAFRSEPGGPWQVSLDRRSGAPLLVEGAGLSWFDPSGPAPTPAGLEKMAREFLASHETLFGIRGDELVVDAQGTAMVDRDRATIVFRRRVAGVEVEDQRVVLRVVRGNLVAFGADRWGALGAVPSAKVSVESARETLYGYMGILPRDVVVEIENGREILVAAPPAGAVGRAYTGRVGAGIRFERAYLFVLRVAGEPGTWVGKVDATTGTVLALYDDARYAQVKGGVYPISDDGNCADYGCELAGFPLPYADVNVGGTPGTANDVGIFSCSPGGSTATTHLAGPYIRINTLCGAVSQSVACDADLDLGTSAGTDCQTPAGASAGDTHSARSSFFHLNRIKEKGRYWLPSNSWLTTQLGVNLDLNQTCNAYWDGASVNFFKSGGGCRNTGEIAGVFNHEYGHGLDENDGGGYDNPSEAYADVTAIVEERRSCVGRGFYMSGTCSGYGDPCLSCTGIRDMDYAQHQSNTPATPSGFISPNCGGGSGACGREVHCESYVPSETIFDLATRDLPAAGYDAKTSWQIAEKLWYKSRQGSGGNVFNCTLPNSDGCNANGWFNSMRTADDDDGNLSNGTPHAAAIFAAFNRHKIACGNSTDPSNQSTSSCPSFATPALTGAAGSASSALSWNAITNASNYLVLRSEISCDYSQNVIVTVAAPGTSYTDTDLPNGVPFYYRVQAQGSNTACESAVSNCVQVTPQPFAGTITFDRSAYSCSGTITVSVLDANIGAPTTVAKVFSNTEPAPETVVLTETPPGSGKYIGTINTTSGPAANGDGQISIADGDTITGQYVDADDGMGGTNVLRQTTALGDCVAPVISQVQSTGLSDVAATITWNTNEAATSTVNWGPVKPPANQSSTPGFVGAHAVQLTGLQQCTTYWYSVRSQDAPGNVAFDDFGGADYHFETLGNLGSGLQNCHAGRVTLGSPAVTCAGTLPIQVTDLDLNLSPAAVDTVNVTVTSTTQSAPVTVTLTETGPNTSVFSGSIAATTSPTTPGDGRIQVAPGDVVTATYHDANDGTGSPAVSFADAVVDCSGPTGPSISVTSLGDDRATIAWTTNEPSTGRVDWGTTSSLGNSTTDSSLTTNHSVLLQPLAECGRVFFRITATDAYGNSSVLDASGTPYAFNAQRIPPGVFKETFESASGWTLTGEFQIGAPQGKGTPPDPSQAFEGANVLGDDLTGLGASPGNYEVVSLDKATSPRINATSLVNAQLRFRRWLNVAGNAAVAAIYVNKTGKDYLVWSSASVADSAWTLQTVNVSQYVDGASNVRITFQQQGSGTAAGTRSGWNIDRVILNSANQPAFEACGSCGGAPTFGGIVSAADPAPCADTGLALTWNAAPAWGTGSGGAYDVYRDVVPSFTPSSGNLLAKGVAGTTYTDTTAAVGTTYYYLVRAENNETCSTGPNNGGLTDSNLVYARATNASSQPPAGAVGASLAANPLNAAHVRLTWAAAPNAATYHVYRASAPGGPFSQIASVAGTLFDDVDQMGSSTPAYYAVRASDACGNEGP